jgi:hypothetical protein
MLLHLIVDDNFDFLHVDLASDYVGILLFEKYYDETLKRMQSLLGGHSALSGHLFECFMHFKFRHSSDLTFKKCRSLENDNRTLESISFPPQSSRFFSDLPRQLEKDVYYQPIVPNYPAFDAITTQGLLQFTTTADHTIKGVRKLTDAIQLYDQQPVKYYFFVPQDIFNIFTKQSIKGETSPQIEQYAVMVNIGLPPRKRQRQ